MHARHRLSHARRRGVVLVLILAMLGLLALIGVSFATLAGQAQSGSRRVVEAMNVPTSDGMMDYALAQLINDTSNPLSAIRGHSLKRDMYGNDGMLNGYLGALSDGTPLAFGTVTANANGTITCATNIPSGASAASPAFNFTNWIVKLVGTGGATQSFEVLIDDTSAATHSLTLTAVSNVAVYNPDPSVLAAFGLPQPASGGLFVLDGRYRRAFNGPGLATNAQFGNFKFNGLDPNAVGMDEDYDGADLENWFMALQSADGSVIIPSFHRPGLLVSGASGDWSTAANPKILRPSAADGNDASTFGALPFDSNGRIIYDVDNDGDGITDSVWVDLGFPPQRDSNGKLYKPLFAFTVQGLNGKLPLNTAGNIQGRQTTDGPNDAIGNPTFLAGDPSHDHVSHIGYSCNEINPKYALQNAPDTTSTLFQQADNAGVPVNLTQLRNLLTGTIPQPSQASAPSGGVNGDSNSVVHDGGTYYLPNNVYDVSATGTTLDISLDGGHTVLRTAPQVAGRWGDQTLIPQVLVNPQSPPGGGTFPDFTAFNTPVRAGRSINFGVAPFALWDAADDNFDGLDFFPSLDTTTTPVTSPETRDLYDGAGAVALPSERIRRFVTPIDPSGNGQVAQFGATPTPGLGADNRGRVGYLMYHRPFGLPPMVRNQTGQPPTAAAPAGPASVGDMSNNVLHGYESQRSMGFTTNHPTGPNFAEATFINQNTTAPTFVDTSAATPTLPPVNSMPNPFAGSYSTATVSKNYNMGSLTTDLADEMNPYQGSTLDSPFGVQDLEWLYRSHDVDGSSLHSRLSQLAPISFSDKVNAPGDGMMRRKMFCGDAYDTINFVYAHDNPDGATFSANHRFTPGVSASLANLGLPTPRSAHGDRKINLNFPLPVSNDPFESVRQHWILDAYNMLKEVLPPTAVDTPEELAGLSQYLINVVDFRDPDGTITIFQNPDLMELPPVIKGAGTPAATQSAPPKLIMTPVAPATPPAGAIALTQYGMEYSPVAITEVLAYAFNRKDTSASPAVNTLTPRLFIEMVNTLTQSSTTVTGPPSFNPSDLNLAGWDLIVAPDDVTGRPDPITGQIPIIPAPIPPATTSYMQLPIGANGLLDASGNPTRLAAMPLAGTPSYYVLANNPPTPVTAGFNPATDESGAPTVNGIFPTPPGPATTPPTQYLIPTSGGTLQTGKYYWLYLRRPANPFDPVTSYTNMVVVDSFRFPFLQSDGTGVNGTPDTQGTTPTVPIYSMSRYQPYRGGHAVPVATAAEPVATPPVAPSPPNAYGYSEQTSPPGGASTFYGLYNSNNPPLATPAPPKTTLAIANSLGRGRGEDWDYLAFHDRDFMSVAELLLVPGCPPGLFTKQFVENAPDTNVFPPNATDSVSNVGAPYPYLTPPPKQPANGAGVTVPDKSDVVGRRLIAAPRTYPYLVDQFYYTATNSATAQIGGQNDAGWYRMFEFFDVPSPNAGTIGPVAQGQNFDWLRQDRKPGQLNINLIIDEEVFLGLIDDYSRINATLATASSTIPQVATGVGTSTSMQNRGYFDTTTNFGMKAAFADFLKLTHGGSGVLFGYGSGAVGTASAVERPYHSLSYPDIDFTLMRPATLPPATPTATSFDPGIKNATFAAPGSGFPPAIPPRRIFEIPDNTQANASATPPTPGSNASELGDSRVNTPINHPSLSNQAADLSAPPVAAGANVWLGGNSVGGGVTDRREHPYFRTEWMQKMMNLTTTRTHQYAVWITVGFFEVTSEGNPQTATPDTLGRELGKAAGRSVRYRSFFLVDRTRAIGFNPQDPGDFRDCVVYRSRIE